VSLVALFTLFGAELAAEVGFRCSAKQSQGFEGAGGEVRKNFRFAALALLSGTLLG
jgi:hypothetical protein